VLLDLHPLRRTEHGEDCSTVWEADVDGQYKGGMDGEGTLIPEEREENLLPLGQQDESGITGGQGWKT
jgi:hypothetical protein